MSFPRYPEYKGSGVEWLGEVPAHWDLVPLKQVISRIESGTSVNAIDTPASDGELGVLKTSCVYHGRFDADENKAVIPDEYDRVACPVTAGTLVVSRMNTPDLVGAAGVVRASYENLFLPDRLWQVHFNGADANFVHHWTHTPIYRAQVEMACAGASSSMQNLGQDQFRCFVIPRPSVDEQTAIATFLDRETAKIDALVAEQEKLIALLQEKRQAVISHAVTKGLDPSVPMKDSGVEWLGEVPAHWDMKRVKDCGCEIVDCKNRTPEPHDEGNYFVVRTSCVKDGQFNPEPGYWTDEANFIEWTAKGRPQAGDVLFTREAPTGEACLAPEGLDFCLGQRMMYIRPPKQVLLGEFLLYSIYGGLARERISEKSKGSTVGHLRVGEVGELPLLLPPLYEQVALIAFVGEELSKLQALAAASESAIALMKERRTALISAAVTGQIDVRGWMPADAASNFIAASAGAESVGG